MLIININNNTEANRHRDKLFIWYYHDYQSFLLKLSDDV